MMNIRRKKKENIRALECRGLKLRNLMILVRIRLAAEVEHRL